MRKISPKNSSLPWEINEREERFLRGEKKMAIIQLVIFAGASNLIRGSPRDRLSENSVKTYHVTRDLERGRQYKSRQMKRS